MPGLIPLMLNTTASGLRQPSGKMHSAAAHPTSPQSASPKSATSSGSSDGALQGLSSSPHLPSAHSSPPALHRLTRRFSSQPSSPALPILPYTQVEWAKAVSEVKRLYLNRRYRLCSARCSGILDNIKDTTTAEPAYLIYLHFYAATSMEMSARALHSSTPHRAVLLRQAETHYTRAADLIQSENVSRQRFSRASTTTSSSSSNIYSPVSSVGSRGSTVSTRLSSPTPSLSGTEERLPSALKTGPPSAAARKKRVTFSFSEPTPMIRPDSPTLGFDAWFEPPPPPELDEPVVKHIPLPQSLPRSPTGSEEEDYMGMSASAFRYSGLFFAEAATDRYACILADLLAQVNLHLRAVRAELQGGNEMPPASSWGSVSSVSGSFSSCASGTSSSGSLDGEEEREADLRARIDRLRQSGWRRRRFDPDRYKALRESVLAEMP
ncbi:uncharacterized protein DNG_00463 [Cephalotrichum gorgonifer]|uniref:Uncharacterized protein n=1 Tax=Cephalotrichum gorgonifer TaxID=2041049 RepID=A0AAE8MQ09_9PEZI|nr:uncharacterized protein DNG_00463 [Cephalotrichum gorgonifer]